MVEQQPSKLMAWVRFPSPAPTVWLSRLKIYALVAQMVERILGKDEVGSSILPKSTKLLILLRGFRDGKE